MCEWAHFCLFPVLFTFFFLHRLLLRVLSADSVFVKCFKSFYFHPSHCSLSALPFFFFRLKIKLWQRTCRTTWLLVTSQCLLNCMLVVYKYKYYTDDINIYKYIYKYMTSIYFSITLQCRELSRGNERECAQFHAKQILVAKFFQYFAGAGGSSGFA